MNYNSVYSLKHMCVIRLATALCNLRVVRMRFMHYSHGSPKYSRLIDEKIMIMVSKLLLPQVLTKKVFDLVIPASLQMMEWEACLLHFAFINNISTCKLHDIRQGVNSYKLWWTSLGVIDKKKTIRILIRDERLPVTNRYELACMYCLEDYIPYLWMLIPDKNLFYKGDDAIEVKDVDLVVFWTYLIKGEIAKLYNVIKRQSYDCTPYQFALEYSACFGNKVAIEYFLQKLPTRKQNKLLVKCAEYVLDRRHHFVYRRVFVCEECHSQSLRFLLSRMNEVQQMEVFRLYPQQVLMSFLDWPWHSFFIPTAEFMFDFLPMEDCRNLLQSIVAKVEFGYKNCGYERLFADFWQKMPESHKRYVVHCTHSFGKLLSALFAIEDRENTEVILKYATSTDRQAVIFSTHGKYICYNLVVKRNFDLLKLLIEQCIPSSTIMADFKRVLREFVRATYSESWGKGNWFIVEQALDRVIHKIHKRKLVDFDVREHRGKIVRH